MSECEFTIRVHTPCFSLYDWAIVQPEPPTYQQALDESGLTLEQLQIAIDRYGFGIGIISAKATEDKLGSSHAVESLDGLSGMYILATEKHYQLFRELHCG